MSDLSTVSSLEADDSMPLMTLGIRGCLGGVLMGLANLVPGISGGTMLLAAGVYPAFIAGIAEISTLRFRTRSIVSLASIVLAAVTGILLLAGTMKELVTLHRWVMYSLSLASPSAAFRSSGGWRGRLLLPFGAVQRWRSVSWSSWPSREEPVHEAESRAPGCSFSRAWPVRRP